MRNEIAEWMLSQATSPEQAATIVGDLLEAQPGPVAFWFAVVRATVSIARHQPPELVFASLFWFSYEASFWLFLAWLFTKIPGYSYSRIFLLMIFAGAVFTGGWWLWARKRESSVAISAAFYTWFLMHNGWPMWVVLLLMLPLTAFNWRRQWHRRKNALPENDRPVAG